MPLDPYGNEAFEALATVYCVAAATDVISSGALPTAPPTAYAHGVYLGFLAGWAVRHYMGKDTLPSDDSIDPGDALEAMLEKFPKLKATLDAAIDGDDSPSENWEG